MLKKDEARNGDARTSTTQTSMNSTGKPNESKNHNTQYRLSGQALPWPERMCVVPQPSLPCLNEVLWKKNLSKHYRKQWWFLLKNFDEGIEKYVVHLDFCWKPASSLGLAIDPELTKCSARDFLKIWPCCLQRHFERLQLFFSEYWDDCKARFSCILMVVLKRV